MPAPACRRHWVLVRDVEQLNAHALKVEKRHVRTCICVLVCRHSLAAALYCGDFTVPGTIGAANNQGQGQGQGLFE